MKPAGKVLGIYLELHDISYCLNCDITKAVVSTLFYHNYLIVILLYLKTTKNTVNRLAPALKNVETKEKNCRKLSNYIGYY